MLSLPPSGPAHSNCVQACALFSATDFAPAFPLQELCNHLIRFQQDTISILYRTKLFLNSIFSLSPARAVSLCPCVSVSPALCPCGSVSLCPWLCVHVALALCNRTLHSFSVFVPLLSICTCVNLVCCWNPIVFVLIIIRGQIRKDYRHQTWYIGF